MQTETAYAMRLMDRREFSSKPRPLTFAPDTSVTEGGGRPGVGGG